MKEVETYTAKQTGKIMLNANELYQDVSGSIKKEIMEELMKVPFHRYPDECNQALIEAYRKVIDIPCENIMAGNGSDEMLGLMIGYFLGKDKTLYTLTPDFSMYDYYTSMQEANILKFECEEDGSFNILDFIEHGRRNNVHMILFSNPNNPTGHYLDNASLKEIVEAFPTIPVIIDEAYSEFAKESMVSYIEQYPNLYVTRTLSKAYGLAGVRLGFLMGNSTNMKKLSTKGVPYNISSIDQKIGEVVLRYAQDYQETLKETIAQRDAFYERVKTLKHVTFYPSQANYVYGRSKHKEALLKTLEDAGIIIRTYANDTFRVTIGSKEENAHVLQLLMAFDKEVIA